MQLGRGGDHHHHQLAHGLSWNEERTAEEERVRRSLFQSSSSSVAGRRRKNPRTLSIDMIAIHQWTEQDSTVPFNDSSFDWTNCTLPIESRNNGILISNVRLLLNFTNLPILLLTNQRKEVLLVKLFLTANHFPYFPSTTPWVFKWGCPDESWE